MLDVLEQGAGVENATQTHGVVRLRDELERVQLFGKIYHRCRLCLQIDGRVIPGVGIAGTKLDARRRAIDDFYDRVAARGDEISAALATARMVVAGRAAAERAACRANHKGKLYNLVQQLQREPEYVSFREIPEESARGATAGTTYIVVVEGREYRATAFGSTRKASGHLAAEALLVQLARAGVTARIVQRAEERRRSVVTSYYALLGEKLREFGGGTRPNQVSELSERYTPGAAQAKAWSCTLSVVINGKAFERTGTGAKKKEARDFAAEQLIVDVTNGELPPPPEGYVPEKSKAPKIRPDQEPISALASELQRLGTGGYTVRAEAPVYAENPLVAETRFRVRWSIAIDDGEKSRLLEAEAAGRTKKEAKRAAAERLLGDLATLSLASRGAFTEKKADYLGELEMLVRSLRTQGDSARYGKLMKSVELQDNAAELHRAVYSITVPGRQEPLTASGSGRSKTMARKAAARVLLTELRRALDLDLATPGR